jgi:hypothetical protein
MFGVGFQLDKERGVPAAPGLEVPSSHSVEAGLGVSAELNRTSNPVSSFLSYIIFLSTQCAD